MLQHNRSTVGSQIKRQSSSLEQLVQYLPALGSSIPVEKLLLLMEEMSTKMLTWLPAYSRTRALACFPSRVAQLAANWQTFKAAPGEIRQKWDSDCDSRS